MKSFLPKTNIKRKGSPPSRGAWIEIIKKRRKPVEPVVAPLAGGVD